jgi:N-acetylneuraminate lyase
MAAAKTVMKLRGVDVGPPRLPIAGLTSNQQGELHRELDKLGFFTWL